MFNYDGQEDLIIQCITYKSFIRWAFSRGNSCADPEGGKGGGDRGPDSPPLENDKLYGFL